ncbi:Ectopic P granules protein 5 [Mortierella sp. NVP85]|nr:Ectopic P granules protein 5 [Mortierella sp. NVP85]
MQIHELQKKADGYASKLWRVKTKTVVKNTTCGDGAAISHNYSFQYGHYETKVAAKLEKTLDKHLSLRSIQQIQVAFEESDSRLWIEDHIATFLSSAAWANETQPDNSTSIDFHGSCQQFLMHVRGYLAILFHFERSVRRRPDFGARAETEANSETEAEEEELKTDKSPSNRSSQSDRRSEDSVDASNSVLQSIHGWISLLAATLLRHGSYLDYEYLTFQVLRTRRIKSWAATFIQCNVPTTWSKAFQDFYITELELVLCGGPLYKQASSHPIDAFSEAALIEPSDLEEDDYSAILDQLDVTLFFDRLLHEHKEIDNNNESYRLEEPSERLALQLFTTIRHMFDILLRALERLKKFSLISKRIAQLLCQLMTILADHLPDLGSMFCNTGPIEDGIVSAFKRSMNTVITYEVELDRILADVMRAVLAMPGHGLWGFLPSIPFKFMTSPTVAVLLEEIALDNIEQWINSPMALLSAAPEVNKLRYKLKANVDESVFLLTALANMAASKFRRGSGSRLTNLSALEQGIALSVTFLLLDVAYVASLEEYLSKPTREILDTICDSYPGILSFILCFMEKNFEEMGEMAQFLFRGLPLYEWDLSREDFVILKRAIHDASDSKQQTGIPHEFRKDLALVMVDLCVQHVSSVPGETESPSRVPQAITNLAIQTGIHFLSGQSPLRRFMEWCWSMPGKLELMHLPVITQQEESRLEMLVSGQPKHPLFSTGLPAFVNTVRLLLTQASRDESLFLQKGWDTLIEVLDAGKGPLLLELIRRLIPMVILSAKDSTAHSLRFAELLHRVATWKQDSMLATAGADAVGSQKLSPTKIPKQLLGIWYLLHSHLEQSQTVSKGSTKVLEFWISAAFFLKRTDHHECTQVMDVICFSCFESGEDAIVEYALMAQQIHNAVDYQQNPGMYAGLLKFAQPGLERVVGVVQERFQMTLPVPQGPHDPSLLTDDAWSLKSYATNFFTSAAVSPVWFAYYVLCVETRLEKEVRYRIGNYFFQHPGELYTPNSIVDVLRAKEVNSRKTLHNFAIWRWAQHLLVLPFDTFLLPLYWQMFFYLYFGCVEQRNLFYGYKFLETSQQGPRMVDQLRDRLRDTSIYFEQETTKATQESDSVKEAVLVGQSKLYHALHGWISEPGLLTVDFRIRDDMMKERLATCRLPDPMDCNPELWKDLLVDLKAMSKSVSSSNTPLSPLSPTESTSSSSSLWWRGMKEHHLRSLRKHNLAQQEHRIEKCLKPQSKSGPEFMSPKALVLRPRIDHTTTPESLFARAVNTIKEYCKTYRDINKTCKDLDKSYLKELEVLYRNEVKTLKKEIACETAPNMKCKQPAVIDLAYEEVVLNDQIKQWILDNRERARASRLGSIEQRLCLASLEITKGIDTLLQLLHSSPHNTRIQELSTRSFHFICTNLFNDARSYPPAELALRSIVDTLGMEIVANDLTQMEDILKLMGTDDFAVQMLYKVFNPAVLPDDFVRLYRRIATDNEYGQKAKLQLLKQFNVKVWVGDESSPLAEVHINSRPSAQDRRGFYEIAIKSAAVQQQLPLQGVLIQHATETSGSERLEIVKLHRDLAGTLLKKHLEQDHIDYLRILFNTCGNMCIESDVLDDFIRIIGADLRLLPVLLPDDSDVEDEAGQVTKSHKMFTTITLSDYDMESLVDFLANYFNENQWGLLDHFSGYATSIASLLAAVLCEERYLTEWMKPSLETNSSWSLGYSNQFMDVKQCRLWRDTQRVFQPWLLCLTNHAMDETQFQQQRDGAGEILGAFVSIVSKMIRTLRTNYRDTSPILVELFIFWLDILEKSAQSEGCINQIKLIHRHFQRLNWKGLELSLDRVERVLEASSKLSDEVRLEYWIYLITEVMAKANSNLRPGVIQSKLNMGTSEWHDTESAFLKLGLTILQDIDLIASDDMDLRDQLLEQLWDVVFKSGDWSVLSTEALMDHVEALKTSWVRAGPWDDCSGPLGMLLHWMRGTVGLKCPDLQEPDAKDISTSFQDNNITLNEDRVLIYFEYVMGLLRAGVSSSVASFEESQRVNFSMDAIPFVIVHLGHVLDQVGRKVDRARHPGFNRALSSLIAVLNLCGNPTSSVPSSPTYSQPFGVVQRGLQKMISEVNVIQLEVIKAVSQKTLSILAMVTLLEETIEREFDLWSGQQCLSTSEVATGGHGTLSGSVYGLEDSTLQQMASANPLIGHVRSSRRYNNFSSSSFGAEVIGRKSWNRIKEQLVSPELREEEFMTQGLEQGAILTMYGRYLQLLEDCERDQEFERVLGLGESLARDLSNLNLKAAEPWKAYQSLLLLRMFFDLVAKEGLHDILQSRFLDSISLICRTLEPWYQDQDSAKGVFGSMGRGTPSSFDTKFRLVIRIIYSYVVVRLINKGYSIHEENNTQARRKSKLANTQDGLSPVSSAMIEELKQLPTKKKDYEDVFTPPSAVVAHGGGGIGLRLPAFIPAIASSLDRVKTIMSPSPPRPASASPPTSATGSPPKFPPGERRSMSQHITGSQRASFQTHPSRWSTSGGSLDTAVELLMEKANESGGDLSSDRGLLSTKKKYGTTTGPATEQRLRLRHGTKNGSEDLTWAVEKIKDLRFTVLETADIVSELLERFYENDDYFA